MDPKDRDHITPGDLFAFEPDGGLYVAIERQGRLWTCFRVHGRIDFAQIYDGIVETSGGTRVCVSTDLAISIHPDDVAARKYCRIAGDERAVADVLLQLRLVREAWRQGIIPKVAIPTGPHKLLNSAVLDERAPSVWVFHDRLRGLHADFAERLHEGTWHQAR